VILFLAVGEVENGVGCGNQSHIVGALIDEKLGKDVLRKTILELVKKGHVHSRILRRKRLQHAYASQHQTQSKNSSITIYLQTAMSNE